MKISISNSGVGIVCVSFNWCQNLVKIECQFNVSHESYIDPKMEKKSFPLPGVHEYFSYCSIFVTFLSDSWWALLDVLS